VAFHAFLIFIENYDACPIQKCILPPNRSYRGKVISVLLKVVKTQIVNDFITLF
jgi:hypothetical protein